MNLAVQTYSHCFFTTFVVVVMLFCPGSRLILATIGDIESSNGKLDEVQPGQEQGGQRV